MEAVEANSKDACHLVALPLSIVDRLSFPFRGHSYTPPYETYLCDETELPYMADYSKRRTSWQFFECWRRQKSLLSIFIQLLQRCFPEIIANNGFLWRFSWAEISEG